MSMCIKKDNENDENNPFEFDNEDSLDEESDEDYNIKNDPKYI